MVNSIQEPGPRALFSLSRKVIVVTGASRGIGKALAESFCDAGATVIGTARSAEGVSWLSSRGGIGLPLEVTSDSMHNQSRSKALFDEIYSLFSTIDCLVNNLGMTNRRAATSQSPIEAQLLVESNFLGAFWLAQAYAQQMKRVRAAKGNVINIASAAGLLGGKGMAVYSSAKAALIQLTRCLAAEWSPKGCRVNAIAPGIIETDMTKNLTSSQIQSVAPRIPLQRIGNTADIIGPAIFLASEASEYMTGQVLVVDGGASAMSPL